MGVCGYCKNESELMGDICACMKGARTALNNWWNIQDEEELQIIESFFKYRKGFEESLKLILKEEKWERTRRVLKGLDLEESYKILNDKNGARGSSFLGENSSIREVFLKFRELLCCYLPYASSNGGIFLPVETNTVPDLEARTAKSYRIVKAFQFIIENSKSLRKDQIIELKEKFKKGKKRESVQKTAGELQARDIEKEELIKLIKELKKELEEVKLRGQKEKERAEQAIQRAELENRRIDVYKRISNLTADEEGELDRISDSAEVKKFFSNALTSRIINEISNCAMVRGDMVYIEEADWIKNEECGSYGFGLFLPDDYQEIRDAFLAEIKTNPKNWKLVKSDHGIFDLHEMIGGELTRVHHCPAFKFTGREEREIKTILEWAERERRNGGQERQQFERNANVETEQGQPQRENEGETDKGVLQVFIVLFWVFVVIAFYWWIIRRIFKVANIFKKGRERNKTLEIFLGTNWNNRKLIIFDYQPTEEERKIFDSSVLVDISLSKLENNVLKTRDLLALVKYYESEGRIKKNSQINELLLVKLENFRLAGNLTSENKAYLSVNINGRVDRIVEELIHLRKVQMFEPIFW